MGVDWMSISLTPDPTSFAFWHAIRDWVEGVKLAAEIDNPEEEVLARVVIDAKPEGIVIKNNSSLVIPEGITLLYSADEGDECVIPDTGSLIWPYPATGGWKKIAVFNAPHQLFLEADWTVGMLEEVLATGYDGGICFRGGTEEEKGMRDYSQMDEMINLLMG
jgi:hypothetical protein